ncbi:uncharacterized protein EAF02_004896 [Botrytis sinoallii]|uniref:uncharacterized protein n=1 Tax=Botrytis sinoallii TaxID=1463999 RepID=UPI0019004A8F|nr:uncharacterized protein EAF02_004896 [Botrytis sinoallii]KAF7884560.1 hypothetical protein EAF02_004896 [Botrytis sinoallii]
MVAHSGARLIAIVKESEEILASKSEMARLQKEYRKAGMDITIITTHLMYKARNKKTKWTVVMDDDTFFPSMRGLLDELALHDHTQPQYIGGLSENWAAVRMYRIDGIWRGLASFLSTPLAKIIHENMRSVKNNMRFTSGDTLLDFPQIDFMGDHSGFYENGRKVLSLHHWKAGSATKYPYEMDKMHLVSDRWQFDNDIVLTNGFSIAKYPKGVVGARGKDVDLRRTEVTWDDKNLDVEHSLSPTRPELNEAQKISWKFLDSYLVDTHVVRQVYLRKGLTGGGDEVLVLNWRQARKSHSAGGTETRH